MVTNFLEIERELDNARECLRELKSSGCLLSLIKTLTMLNLEVRNHIQGKPISLTILQTQSSLIEQPLVNSDPSIPVATLAPTTNSQ